MKKITLIFILVLLCLGSIIFIGCQGKKEEVKEEESVVFEENDFKKNMLDSYNTESTLEFEGRYIVGFMYSEGFSTDENGTFINGNLQLTGKAMDPSDIGDETVVGGRKYTKNTTSTGNLDLVLPSGNSISGFYQKYFIPLEYDSMSYAYEEVDAENGRLMIEESTVTNEVINGRNGFVHQYTFIEFDGNKSDGIILSGSIYRVIIQSYIDISSYMKELLSFDFGNKFMFADQINQTLGDDFTEGILSIEEFKVEFE
ncbi:MAG: hypothetical protein FD141_1450 [Fusobacteria bacterium]|nr:MAG: hypothetical protein FD141_1450 [Fusobacteriota bacterium]KAF0230163.1 MAG: hypothetical protein FD182_553 [Fusobacteriota bacterium]